MARLALNPDRLLPADPGVRPIARELYQAVCDLPILSPHSRLAAAWLADEREPDDPTTALLSPDDAVAGLLHSGGVPLPELGLGPDPLDPEHSRAAFRTLCSHWDAFTGTGVRLRLEAELVDVLGVDDLPSAETADDLYDAIAARLAEPGLRPRAVADRFGIEFVATLDDPCDDLAGHVRIADDPGWRTQVVPTFAPDAYLDPTGQWHRHLARLAATTGTDTGTLPGWVAAMRDRRAYFKAHGAVAASHTHPDLRLAPLEPGPAARLYASARAGALSPDDAAALRSHLLFEQARMSADDGLVMVLHATGRGTDPAAALAPVLTAFGTATYLQVVVLTADQSCVGELASLAGRRPAVFAGVPWWLLDAPDALARFRATVTEVAGFGRTSGHLDHTAAFWSIPGRHDAARRIESGCLARLVAEHRLSLDEALLAATDLVTGNPRKAFKL